MVINDEVNHENKDNIQKESEKGTIGEESDEDEDFVQITKKGNPKRPSPAKRVAQSRMTVFSSKPKIEKVIEGKFWSQRSEGGKITSGLSRALKALKTLIRLFMRSYQNDHGL